MSSALEMRRVSKVYGSGPSEVHALREVDLVVELGHAPATVEQLLALKSGDFIELDLLALVQAKVDGVPVFDCHYGTSNGKYAIKIEQMLTGNDFGWLGEPNVT